MLVRGMVYGKPIYELVMPKPTKRAYLEGPWSQLTDYKSAIITKSTPPNMFGGHVFL